MTSIKCLIAVLIFCLIYCNFAYAATEEKYAEALKYFNKAKVYQEKKSIDQAIENYKLAIKTDPEMLAAYSQLGLIYAENGDYENSIKVFREYMRLTDNEEEKRLVKQFIDKMSSLIDKNTTNVP